MISGGLGSISFVSFLLITATQGATLGIEENCLLPQVQNGQFDTRNGEVVEPGQTVTLQCEPGYVITKGYPKAKCVRGQFAPPLGNCALILPCTLPSAETLNGHFISADGSKTLGTFASRGTVASLVCNNGYVVHDGAAASYCRNGNWTFSFGSCRKYEPCGPSDIVKKEQSIDLVFAARIGNRTEVASLLARGADPDSQDENGWTGLMWAASNNYTAIMPLLLNCNASVDLINSVGSTALLFAAKSGNIDGVKLLLSNGNGGANPNVTNKFGSTALSFAAQNGQGEIVQILLKDKTDLTASDSDGNTALLWATRGNHPEIVQRLLMAGADPNAAKNDDTTPLMVAAKEGYLKIAQTLLENGAKADVRDSNGYTAFDLANEEGHSDMVDLLAPQQDAETTPQSSTTDI